jgi:hypothetical protein
MGSIESHLQRGLADASFPAAAAILGVVEALDDGDLDGMPLTARLAMLDQVTTQPLWDAGHLALGMGMLEHVTDMEVQPPASCDPALIAAARSAVPRALKFLTEVASVMIEAPPGARGLEAAGGLRLLAHLELFDRHDVDEGLGTGTV